VTSTTTISPRDQLIATGTSIRQHSPVEGHHAAACPFTQAPDDPLMTA
jgi:hypothetical protein